MEKCAGDKHFSLLQIFVSYRHKKVYNIALEHFKKYLKL